MSLSLLLEIMNASIGHWSVVWFNMSCAHTILNPRWLYLIPTSTPIGKSSCICFLEAVSDYFHFLHSRRDLLYWKRLFPDTMAFVPIAITKGAPGSGGGEKVFPKCDRGVHSIAQYVTKVIRIFSSTLNSDAGFFSLRRLLVLTNSWQEPSILTYEHLYGRTKK